jgi:hypothetical protein
MSAGCTSGAKRIGSRYFLFKNRDLIWEDFSDSVVFDEDVFLVRGADVASGNPVGAALGVNKLGLAAANTTVLVTDDSPYDLLLERILRECEDIESAMTLVQEDMSQGSRYQWANFVLADRTMVAAIELGDDEAQLETDLSMVTRTNHHLLLPTAEQVRSASAAKREAGGPLQTSQKRRQIAAKLLETATSTQDVIQLLGTHSDGLGFDSICRHWTDRVSLEPYRGATVYSYIIEVFDVGLVDLDIRIHVSRGNPCIQPFFEFELNFKGSPAEREMVVNSFP